MCLRAINKIYKPDNTIRKGYKILNKVDKLYYSQNNHEHKKPYTINRWYKAFSNIDCLPYHIYNGKTNTIEKQSYKTGFFIFPKLKDAKLYLEQCREGVIVQVEYKQRTIRGIDDNFDGYLVDIAQYMRIIKEIPNLKERNLYIDISNSIKIKCDLNSIEEELEVVLLHKGKKVTNLTFNVSED